MQKLLLMISILCISGCASMNHSVSKDFIANPPLVYNKAGIETFAEAVACANKVSTHKVMAILEQAKVQPAIIAAMNKPFEHLSWARYQALYVRPSILNGGVQFWQENQSALSTAVQQYGVPVQVVMAILGVETMYGKNIGQYRALDALFTLAFDYPRRATYFQHELTAFLSLSLNSQLDPLAIKSSYAGALGMPQFMPSNYLKYGVSASGKQTPDLFTNSSDAISSIAHYLKEMGWKKNQPVAIRARLTGKMKVSEVLLSKTYTLAAFKQHGIHAEDKLPGTLRANLILVQGKQGNEYWLTFKNFYIIKKYNASNLYALAVYQVAEALSCKIPAAQNNGVNCTSR